MTDYKHPSAAPDANLEENIAAAMQEIQETDKIAEEGDGDDEGTEV